MSTTVESADGSAVPHAHPPTPHGAGHTTRTGLPTTDRHRAATTTGSADVRPGWLPVERFPFAVRRLTVPSGTAAVVDEGEGPTLVFVHAGMWSFVFRDVITRLRADFRCVALDFPGFGLAADTPEAVSLKRHSAVLTDVIAALDLRDMTLVAHDLGGPVALSSAAALTARVRGLVMANTFAWTPDTPGLRAMLRIIGSRAATAVGASTNLVARLSATSFGVGRHLDAADRQAFRGPFRDPAVRRRFHRLMASALAERAFTDGVEQATRTVLADLPVLTVFGERNDPFGFQARIGERFADHEDVVVARGNHFPMMDDPEVVARSVRDWHARAVAGPSQP